MVVDMRRPRSSATPARRGRCAALLAGCGTAISGKPVSVFADPFKVGGLEAVDGPTGLRPDAKPPSPAR